VTPRNRWIRPWLCCALLCLSPPAPAADDTPAAGAKVAAALDPAQPSLDQEQQRAAGIVVARPPNATAPQHIDALGVVLDAATLVADFGEAEATAAAERSAAAEFARLRALYQGGAGASLKMIEAARADQARTRAQAQSAAARVSMNWSPIAAMAAAPRGGIIDAVSRGHGLLLRADIAGRHTIGDLPERALLDVDGLQLAGRVLGVLRQTTELQSVGLLIELPDAPAGLAAGARVPVSLFSAARSGVLVPRDAVLYDENGAYVYRRAKPKPTPKPAAGAPRAEYAAVKVRLLQPDGDGWLVTGIDDDDDIVVHGAGVLWSLQGVGAHAVDDDDD
jgi:hypothetical protein